jgi:hypothetical protein
MDEPQDRTLEMVACVRCGAWVALELADLVGNGYRCAACSLCARIEEHAGLADVADHLAEGDLAGVTIRGSRWSRFRG